MLDLAAELYLLLAGAGAMLDLVFFVLGATERRFDSGYAFACIWAVFVGFLALASAALSTAFTPFVELGLHVLAYGSPPAHYGAPPDPLSSSLLFYLFVAELAAAGFFYPLGAKLTGAVRPAPQAAGAAVGAARRPARAAAWRGPGVVLGRDGRLYVLVKREKGRG